MKGKERRHERKLKGGEEVKGELKWKAMRG